MKTFFLSSYQMFPINGGSSRKGYLLKVESDQWSHGYADIFPWVEFGDPSWEEIPGLIKKNDWSSSLLSRSLFLAEKDGMARQNNVSLVDGKTLKNHYSVPDTKNLKISDIESALKKGFASFKFKVCRDEEKELEILKELSTVLTSAINIRLDCNGLGSKSFFDKLKALNLNIEFIEDPYSQPQAWQERSDFAYDQAPFAYEEVGTSWQVIKPAKQSITEIKASKIIFTSYLDHPVGQAHAFCEALNFGPQEFAYGLMSHNVYKPNDFYANIITNGPNLSFVPGQGVGFDLLLSQQRWEKV